MEHSQTPVLKCLFSTTASRFHPFFSISQPHRRVCLVSLFLDIAFGPRNRTIRVGQRQCLQILNLASVRRCTGAAPELVPYSFNDRLTSFRLVSRSARTPTSPRRREFCVKILDLVTAGQCLTLSCIEIFPLFPYLLTEIPQHSAVKYCFA